MKKTKKIMLLFASLLIIAGIVLFATGMYFVHWDFFELDTTVYSAQELNLDNQIFEDKKDEDGKIAITKAVIDIKGWNIKIVIGESFNLSYFTTKKTVVEKMAFNDGVLNIKIREQFDFVNIDSFNQLKKIQNVYVLTIPEKIEADLNFTNSDVSVADAEFKDFKIDVTNGDLNFKNTVFNNFSSDGTNNTFRFNNCTFLDLTLYSTNARMALTDCAVAGNLKYGSTNGDAVFNNSTVSGSSVIDGTNDDIKIKNSTFAGFTAHSTNSGFIIENSKFASIKYNSTNAELKTIGYIDCKSFDLSGTNATFVIKLKGVKEDLKEVKFNGTNEHVEINGIRIRQNYSGGGDISITADSTNLTLKIIFNE